MRIRPVPTKTLAEIAREWDSIALIRRVQIESGQDISFNHILLPAIQDLTVGADLTSVLDVGCGTGFVSAALSTTAGEVTGVDISRQSIASARERFAGRTNTHFVVSSIEDYATKHARQFTLAVAHMSLISSPNLGNMLDAISLALRPNSQFVFTMTHPWFWSFYWGYNSEPWFDYSSELLIEAPFRISLDASHEVRTTHVHRPLEQYVRALIAAKLRIERLVEPMPSRPIAALYPEPWNYPRFLCGKCRCTTS